MTQKISFSVDGQKIAGTLIYPEEKKEKYPAMMFVHGWMSSEKGYIERAKPIADLGYVCLTFSLRGHGESEGKLNSFSRYDHLRDCISAYDFLSGQKYINKDTIHVSGSSYGGYLASMLTTKRNIASLALKAPALYPDENFEIPTLKLIRNNIMIYRQKDLKFDENLALSAIHNYPNKIFLIECEKDDDIPKATINNYLSAANKTNIQHIVIPESDHRSSKPEWNRFFIDQLVEWFKKIKYAGN